MYLNLQSFPCAWVETASILYSSIFTPVGRNQCRDTQLPLEANFPRRNQDIWKYTRSPQCGAPESWGQHTTHHRVARSINGCAQTVVETIMPCSYGVFKSAHSHAAPCSCPQTCSVHPSIGAKANKPPHCHEPPFAYCQVQLNCVTCIPINAPPRLSLSSSSASPKLHRPLQLYPTYPYC